ncbi:hypothetical protein BDR07DRAFT_1380725, partial [Suillus spraguei]
MAMLPSHHPYLLLTLLTGRLACTTTTTTSFVLGSSAGSLTSAMKQEDTFDIMEEIVACGILNSSPRNKKAERSALQPKTSDADDGGWTTDIDISGLLVAIENCVILDTREASVKQNKCSQGRPKKRAIKCTMNHPTHHVLLMMLSMSNFTESLSLHTTMMEEDAPNIVGEIMACGILDSSPHRKTDIRLPQYEAPDAENISSLVSAIENCGILDNAVSDDRCDTDTDISGLLSAIENCGILDHAAPDLGDDGYNTDTDISGMLSAIENCGILDTRNNVSKESKHQRGRPKKKVTKSIEHRSTKKRELIKADTIPSATVQQDKSRKTPIHVTISPAPEFLQAGEKVIKVRDRNLTTTGVHEDVAVTGLNKMSRKKHEIEHQREKKGRGRPKKRVV